MQPFDARWPCPFAPLSTLRLPPHSDRRMTRGEGGRLLLPSAGLPPAVLRQLAWRTPAWSLSRPRRPFSIEVLQTMSLPPSSAPTVTGWSDSCRAGFAPAEDWRLFAAHCSTSSEISVQVRPEKPSWSRAMPRPVVWPRLTRCRLRAAVQAVAGARAPAQIAGVLGALEAKASTS